MISSVIIMSARHSARPAGLLATTPYRALSLNSPVMWSHIGTYYGQKIFIVTATFINIQTTLVCRMAYIRQNRIK